LYPATRSQSTINPPVETVKQEEEVGKFPTNEEKRKTVEDFFRDFPGSSELSNREIASSIAHYPLDSVATGILGVDFGNISKFHCPLSS
jgi:hypothetical protein